MGRLFAAMFSVALFAPALADTSFPFLQDGRLREGFVLVVANGCIERMVKHAGITVTDKDQFAASADGQFFAKYCLCYGRAMADMINSQEYDQMVLGRQPDTFLLKAQQAGAVCNRQAQ